MRGHKWVDTGVFAMVSQDAAEDADTRSAGLTMVTNGQYHEGYAPRVSSPTNRDANAARPKGGVWSTERPEAGKVRMRIGGSVKFGTRGRTWRNVDGGISAANGHHVSRVASQINPQRKQRSKRRTQS